MGHSNCCMQHCKNTGVNSDFKFYRFPTSKYKLKQRHKWIAALRKAMNAKNWTPKPHSLVCSYHFVGGRKSEDELSPSYTPTVFTQRNKIMMLKELQATKRHNRFLKRRIKTSNVRSLSVISQLNENTINCENSESVERYIHDDAALKTSRESFTCIIYEHGNQCDNALQTEIMESAVITNLRYRKTMNVKCGPDKIKTFTDVAVGPNSPLIPDDMVNKKKIFCWIFINKFRVSKEDRLFMFMIKLKTGLSFSAMEALFQVHRTTISRIFFTTLKYLKQATKEFIFWPGKDTINGLMPECFKPDYSNVRVIIDCTEFRIDISSSVDNRVLCYSHYKKGFTAKVLIGITPSGFISFKSKVCGGRKSDSQITIESGLIDQLEHGDTVLADKGFPEFQSMIDNSGKTCFIIIPPFLQQNKGFAKQETDLTYNIAKVRIHVERIMQRLRTYRILDKIPQHLFTNIDDILHMCCVLVNLQPPIIFEVSEVIKENEVI
ncbi:uncharacterized protein [Prorops nasuta]|uniref:uncharacterized protein n=1 Tax=Prorops nasuta TaxID=863751 RepID=UPI0034CD60F4